MTSMNMHPNFSLKLSQLSCGYGEKPLFQGLDLKLHAGQMARVHGQNGAGKTTLLRTLANLQRPLAGHISWYHPQTGQTPDPCEQRLQTCFIGHHNALNGMLTPVENLEFMMQLAGWPVSPAYIHATLEKLGLARLARRATRLLSAGQRRRVALARLWLTGARTWLLDEPAAALDQQARTQLAGHLDAHVQNGGLIIFTTHDEVPVQMPVQSITLPSC